MHVKKKRGGNATFVKKKERGKRSCGCFVAIIKNLDVVIANVKDIIHLIFKSILL